MSINQSNGNSNAAVISISALDRIPSAQQPVPPQTRRFVRTTNLLVARAQSIGPERAATSTVTVPAATLREGEVQHQSPAFAISAESSTPFSPPSPTEELSAAETGQDSRSRSPDRKSKRKTSFQKIATPPLTERPYLTIAETATIYPFTESALRHLVFESEAYLKRPKGGLRSEGFARCVVRPPGQRRVLIDVAELRAWLHSCP